MSDTLDEIRNNFATINTVDKVALKQERVLLKQKLEGLFECEGGTAKIIKEKIDVIDRELDTLDDFPLLDTSFFTQTVDVKGFKAPKFSFINIENEKTEIQYSAEKTKLFSGFKSECYIRRDFYRRDDRNYKSYFPNCLEESVEKTIKSNDKTMGRHLLRAKFLLTSTLPVTAFLVAIGLGFIAYYISGTSPLPFFFTILFSLASGIVCVIGCELVNAGYKITNKCTVTFTDSLAKTIIPDKEKGIIKEVGHRFKKIWIMKEATWDIEIDQQFEANLHYDPDPLLIGESNGKLYVLSCFDLTPAEEYIKREFSVKGIEHHG